MKLRVAEFEYNEETETHLEQTMPEVLEQMRSGHEVVLCSSRKYNNLFYLFIPGIIYQSAETFKKFEQFLKENFLGVGFLWLDGFKAFYVAEKDSVKSIKSSLYHKLCEFEL